MKILYNLYNLFINTLLIKKHNIRKGSKKLLDLLIKIDSRKYYSDYKIKLKDGRIFRGNLANSRYRTLFWDGVHEPTETKLISLILQEDDDFVDVGANIGWYTTLAAQRLKKGTVYAFEPIPVVADSLLANIKANKYNNVIVNNLALGDSNGIAEINFNNNEWGLSSLKVDLQNKEILNIKIRKFDDWVIENNLKKLDVIKCDIEGAEYLFLNGSANTIQKFLPTIIMEIAPNNLKAFNTSACEIITFLNSLGYLVYSINSYEGLIKLNKIEDKNINDQINVIAFNPNNSNILNRISRIKSDVQFDLLDIDNNNINKRKYNESSIVA